MASGTDVSNELTAQGAKCEDAENEDFTIIANDDTTFPISRLFIQAARCVSRQFWVSLFIDDVRNSPVFRDMFSLSSPAQELRLDTEPQTARVFVDILQGTMIPIKYPDGAKAVHEAMNLFTQFDCHTAVRLCLSFLRVFLRDSLNNLRNSGSNSVMTVLGAAIEQQDWDLACAAVSGFGLLESDHESALRHAAPKGLPWRGPLTQ